MQGGRDGGDGGGNGDVDGGIESTAPWLFFRSLSMAPGEAPSTSGLVEGRLSWGYEEDEDVPPPPLDAAAGRAARPRSALLSWLGGLDAYLETKFTEDDDKETGFQESRRDEIFKATLINLGIFSIGYTILGTATIAIYLSTPMVVWDMSSATSTSTSKMRMAPMISLLVAGMLALPLAFIVIAASPKMNPKLLETVKSITIAFVIGCVVVLNTLFVTSLAGHAVFELSFVVAVVGPGPALPPTILPSDPTRKGNTATSEAWTGTTPRSPIERTRLTCDEMPRPTYSRIGTSSCALERERTDTRKYTPFQREAIYGTSMCPIPRVFCCPLCRRYCGPLPPHLCIRYGACRYARALLCCLPPMLVASTAATVASVSLVVCIHVLSVLSTERGRQSFVSR